MPVCFGWDFSSPFWNFCSKLLSVSWDKALIPTSPTSSLPQLKSDCLTLPQLYIKCYPDSVHKLTPAPSQIDILEMKPDYKHSPAFTTEENFLKIRKKDNNNLFSIISQPFSSISPRIRRFSQGLPWKHCFFSLPFPHMFRNNVKNLKVTTHQQSSLVHSDFYASRTLIDY